MEETRKERKARQGRESYHRMKQNPAWVEKTNKRQREYMRIVWRVRPEVREHNRLWNRETSLKMKKEVYDYYGRICVCCGETNELFLTVDHINNDGNQQRRKIATGRHFYAWIIKNNFPSNLQILCYNCNNGRSRNRGICPHKNNQ